MKTEFFGGGSYNDTLDLSSLGGLRARKLAAFDINDSSSSMGLDSFVGGNKSVLAKKVVLATKKNLLKFRRVGKNTLIHKSTKDLWALKDDGTIVALYDPDKEPLIGT